ncbi:MAG: hypothetical protein A2044_01850 [Candidatus Firestonebacteria bacterium GWA2_43_8]|nr:MAG: hypothetical protein A2044_01850 [Candidatus Firestonebacteria bacterium GWA2_43_8]
MMKDIFILLLFVLAVVIIENPSVVFAEDGRSFNSRPDEPKRIISLTPGNTEILFALGLGDRIVGVAGCCDYPEAVKKCEKIGDYAYPDLEKIMLLKPDLVLCGGGVQKEFALKLIALKIPSIALYPENLKEVSDGILVIGKAAGREKEAVLLIKRIEDRMNKVKSMITKDKKPKVYFEIWNLPLISAGKGSFIDELITLAGGENIFSNVNKAFPQVSAEEVIKRNPDIIITAYMGKKGRISKELINRSGWSKVKAVKENRVFDDIDSDLLLRPGPRLADGLEEISKKIQNSTEKEYSTTKK